MIKLTHDLLSIDTQHGRHRCNFLVRNKSNNKIFIINLKKYFIILSYILLNRIKPYLHEIIEITRRDL